MFFKNSPNRLSNSNHNMQWDMGSKAFLFIIFLFFFYYYYLFMLFLYFYFLFFSPHAKNLMIVYQNICQKYTLTIIRKWQIHGMALSLFTDFKGHGIILFSTNNKYKIIFSVIENEEIENRKKFRNSFINFNN